MPAKSKFEEKMPILLQFYENGYSNAEAARKAGISEGQLYEWLKTKPKFSEVVQRARKDGEANAVRAVESALLDLAKGFEYEEVRTEYESKPNPDEKAKEKYIPTIKKQVRIKKRVIPSVEAIKFYLTNKAPEDWKNRIEQNNTGNLETNLKITHVTKDANDKEFPSSEAEVED